MVFAVSEYTCASVLAVLKSTVYTLIAVTAIAVLFAALLLPMLQIYGNTMAPALQNGGIISSLKISDFDLALFTCSYSGQSQITVYCSA